MPAFEAGRLAKEGDKMTRRKDGLWQEVVNINGTKKYFYGKTKAEVLQKIRVYQESQANGKLFCAVADEWEAEHREEIGAKTWNNYRPHFEDIKAKHGGKAVKAITAADIINDLNRAHALGYSATIISTRRSLYRMILGHAVANGDIAFNPALGVSMPKGLTRKRREAPDDEIIQTIMKSTDKPFGLFPALLICTGLRKAEALALTWSDIGTDCITVNKALDYTIHAHPVLKAPKTRAGYREIPIISILKPLLKKPASASGSDLLFPGTASNRNPSAKGYMTERQYEGAWNRYCKSVGLVDENGKPTITAHCLRHGMATLLFESGVDELTAQALLGHASPTTTRNIYTHLRIRQRAKSIDALNKNVYEIVYNTEKPAKILKK